MVVDADWKPPRTKNGLRRLLARYRATITGLRTERDRWLAVCWWSCRTWRRMRSGPSRFACRWADNRGRIAPSVCTVLLAATD
ncbi:Uncharacterised protein [Mycobacteroides abscessus subsp. massiliense]|nr:Uncharacterised protein [Mycobacteroides abscessus subsp. abscessus]SKK90600.1 Uncharacterised protein [Mycobacteroides abscessus subsp. massiliense]SHY44130.1 Uncharacterised protein [Mycobacteroides abscessus subsp. abscessus]SKL77849.1 Uncharacterised protein [Mycobacteroides abscessus subsp. massiliense]SKM11217.1 Uncharacterised protein [Mycobacteroides abscessus subsp. massiliense]